MSGVLGWVIAASVLIGGLVIYYTAEFCQWLRGRHLDREARERRDEQIGASIAALKPGPLEDPGEAAALFGSLTEQPRSSSGGKR